MLDVSHLLESGAHSDFKIVCGDGTEFAVHKAIICPQSTFFQAACTVDMKEKSEGFITLPESSDVVKALLNFYYSPDAVDDVLYPDMNRDDTCYHYDLRRLAHIYVAADKYDVPVLKKAVLSEGEASLSDANDDILRVIQRRPSESDDRAAKEEWRSDWESYFLDLTEAIEILLEHTSDDDDIRKSLLAIEWARFAIGEDRERWLSIVERWPGYAVDLMAHQAGDQWFVDQAQRVERAREAAEQEKADAAKKPATAPATSA